jgi:hypothetical protein
MAGPEDALVEAKRQKFYPRYRRKTAKGTRTTLARPDGNLDHVLVALRKELREELRWQDEEMRRPGFHTVLPMGERGLYVVALTPEDAALAGEFARVLRARRFLERGTLRDTDEDVE